MERLDQQDLIPEEKMGHLFPTKRDWSLVEEIQRTGLPVDKCGICEKALSVPYYAAKEEDEEKSKPIGHKVCIDLPMEMEHHLLHPGHQLLRKTRETAYDALVCNSCNGEGLFWSHVYYECSDCEKFLLCIICALKLFPINHKCHPQHPLIPNHKIEEFHCDACSMVHTDAISYECTTCPSFRVNQYCVSPRIVKLPSHCHHVRLVYSIPETQFGEPIYCQICKQHLKGQNLAYHCARCRYYFHIHSCGSLKLFNTFWDAPRVLVEEEGADAESEPKTCDVCQLNISVPYYAASWGDLMHKFCAELPEIVQHRLHPGHELNFGYSFDGQICGACNAPWEGYSYSCPRESCRFSIDIICALKNIPSRRKFHKHPLIASHAKGLYACHACDKDSDGPSYQCTTCRYWVHYRCGSAPMYKKHEMHPHPLKLTYSVQDTVPEDDDRKFHCHVCRQEMNLRHWAYYCAGCKYYIHAHDCSDPSWTREIDESDYEAALAAAVRLPAVDSQSVTLATLCFMDTNTDGKPLLLDPDETCHRCAKLLAPPCNNCALCNYFLSKSPAELDDHDSLIRGYYSMLKASSNQTNCNGFAVVFRKNVLRMTISSSVLPRYVKHEGHRHVLFSTIITEETWCNACEGYVHEYAFRCKICNFTIHTYCALLPGSIRHSYDKKHPFKLTYYSIEGVEEYVCELCEGDITTMWFYHCAKCDYSIHPRCIWRYVIDFGPSIHSWEILVPTTNIHPIKCYLCDQEETTGCRYSVLQFYKTTYHLECLNDSEISEIERWPREREELVSKLAELRSKEG